MREVTEKDRCWFSMFWRENLCSTSDQAGKTYFKLGILTALTESRLINGLDLIYSDLNRGARHGCYNGWVITDDHDEEATLFQSCLYRVWKAHERSDKYLQEYLFDDNKYLRDVARQYVLDLGCDPHIPEGQAKPRIQIIK